MEKRWVAKRRFSALRGSTPDLVPARMINEVLYCERLAYLEWSQGEFKDNVFTVDGRVTHARVDARQGSLPLPRDPDLPVEEPVAEEPRPYVARSVWLSSEALGITAKIDVVEGEAGEATPIEYKRGQAPDVPEGAYLPERAQVCAQVLLLREHGFACDHAEIYFAGSRRRVRIEITAQLVETTRQAAARVRALSERGELPPPLVDSPKCDGCSLVGICLPDEVAQIGRLSRSGGEEQLDLTLDDEAEPRALRRLHPLRDDQVPLYVQAYSGRLRLDGERLLVETRDGVAEARLPMTSQVSVFGNVQVTTQTIAALLEREIPLCFFSYGGWFRGRTVAAGHKNIELRVAQHAAFADAEVALALARSSVASKILNCRTMLRRNHTDPSEVTLKELEILARQARTATAAESLLGLEGAAARLYFQSFAGMLRPPGGESPSFDFTSRNRRPPKDPVNALLSFVYGLLTKELTLTLTTVGLEPLLGYYHRPRYGRPALALDMMEELRPLIADSVVLQVVNTGVVGPDDFVTGNGACALTAAARRRVIQAYERRMDTQITHPVFGYRISYRRVLEVQARLLGRFLLGEIDFVPPFRTR